MNTFFVIFICFKIFKLIKNQRCDGVRGVECCTGYAFNKDTGDCEKCPKGYFGDCSKRCTPPTYGDNCQSICDCKDGFYCHFAFGCSQRTRNETDHLQISSTNHFSTRLTPTTFRNPISNVTVLLLDFTQHFSESASETTLNNLSTNFDGFKNNNVFLILIGIFVFFFAIFVVTYIYLKCFRKASNSRKTRENELQAQYKSLDFEAMEPEPAGNQVNLEQRGRFISDSSYLSPVFVIRESHREPRVVHENETSLENNMDLPEPSPNGQETTSADNDAIFSSGELTEHVYIEITEDNLELETNNFIAGDDRENKEDIKTKSSNPSHIESSYANESK